MNCREARRLLGLFIAGELEGKEREEVEGHLAACSRCAREVEGLGKVLELLGDAREPARALKPETVLALRGWGARAHGGVPYRAIAWAAAAAVVVALLLAFGVQARVGQGGLVIAIGRQLPPAAEPLGKDEALALSRQVVEEALDEAVAPAFAGLSDTVRGLYAGQNDDVRAALDELDAKWEERFATLRLDVRDVYWSTMDEIWQTNGVLNRTNKLVASLFPEDDLTGMSHEEGGVE